MPTIVIAHDKAGVQFLDRPGRRKPGGVTVQALVRRLLAVVSTYNLFDELLPPVRAHSLGAAA